MDVEVNGEGSRVLVIQDYPPVQLEPMTKLLRQFGYQVLTAAEGQRGLDIASKQSPHVILCDITMPDMNASDLCRHLRSNSLLNGLPVLVVGGLRNDSEAVIAALKAGANDYLRMPYDPVHLLVKTGRLVERRRAEAAFRQRESYYRLMIENSPDRISIVRVDMTTVYENPAVERQTGYIPEELIGKKVFSLVHPDDLEHVLATEVGELVQYRYLHKDGSWRWLESVGKEFIDESGTLSVVMNTREITDRKK